MTPATARSRDRTHARSRIAPRGPRRISGPVAAGAATLPRPRTGTTGLFARVRGLPEHRVVDRLLRSRLWIWALGLLLGGIVTMQVSLLKLNSGISRAVETATTLERQNADLEASIAELSSGERVRAAAAQDGMVTPAAGDVSYLHARDDRDASLAARRMEPPSEEAAAIMANGGREPGVLAATELPTEPEVVAPDPNAAATATPVPTATPDPAATTATQLPADNGAAVAPQG